MSQVPWYILSATLVLLLVIREYQTSRTIKGLLDRVLQNHGMAALPESHPLTNLLEELKPTPEPVKKAEQARVMFKVPGMPQFKRK